MIKIDLTELTQEHLDQCKPHMGACLYASPCIIGTLITERERSILDDIYERGGEASIGTLNHRGHVTIPKDQIQDAVALQSAFDNLSLIHI